ncbi:hypothetical protein Pcinc_025852 [Petrolisthes cinctipes]|uniref:Uncharacterized protein n=1 Tax=Petrolisthes cinctipes TaxID=88211 RepID=A0AAE1F771_PETCI|nr:hypothetical protein Pcinc_025852 [Petrolisthes cinctipes]
MTEQHVINMAEPYIITRVIKALAAVHSSLGDRKPSQFLRHLLELTKPHITDKDSPWVRQIILQALPDISLPFLQFLPPETPLDTLAGTLDRVVSSLHQASAAVNVVSSTEFLSDQECPLAWANSARLDKISQTLDEICHQLKSQHLKTP